MKVIAHRGRPENTVQGIRSAVRLGVDAVEFDARLHPSGTLYLMHDATLDRTTAGRGLLADATAKDLKALAVPTLDEALDACGTTHAMIELKTSGKTAEAVATVLNKRRKGAWTVSSFDHRQLLAFKAMCPSVDVAPIVYGVPLDCVQCALALRAKSIAVSREFLDPRMLRHAQDHGILVNVYTVNTERELRDVMAAGLVSGIFTDYPEDMIRLVDR
jgi:glycerophosphoryl diester phosphodiesterase